MTSRFRPVWLVLDPYTGGRALIGMLVADGGRIEFVPAPDADRVRRPTQQNIVDLAAGELAGATCFDDLPIALGPQVVLGEPSAVPATVESPARWVAERVIRHGEAV